MRSSLSDWNDEAMAAAAADGLASASTWEAFAAALPFGLRIADQSGRTVCANEAHAALARKNNEKDTPLVSRSFGFNVAGMFMDALESAAVQPQARAG